MGQSQPEEIFLSQYKTPVFFCEKVSLDIEVFAGYSIVKNVSHYIKNPEHSTRDLVLDGMDLEIQSIKIDEKEITDYIYKDEELTLKSLPNEFNLETIVKILPEKNFSGEGFYKSGDIYCTQCEAEGFRRITFHQDRPDIMSSYETKITADKKLFPKLLSNGNKTAAGDLDNGRHFVSWEDPHKKPCYLFAMVAGDLALVSGEYKTTEGRNVALEIFVDHGNEEKCDHAMESLKQSMRWDEEKFNLAYDLDIYMVVAVDSFNMGAMENKGLNIFNSAYVLAKPATATDSDFQGVEGVIGHEYFHNWTGNRVTCRDWFQLTLKEGLTVFRDQEFSADMGSRSVRRIEEIKSLKASQFAEDRGPLSHPIQPKSYIEINNFYSATIYSKGAEIIRMVHTIIGAENFKKGMALYFERFDGQAVTCSDFITAMADASGTNFDQFRVWYDQNGTPELNIETNYNAGDKTFTIDVAQSCKTNNEKYNSLAIPFHFHLYQSSGEQINLDGKGEMVLDSLATQIVLKDIESAPVCAWNTSFAAPVNINYDQKDSDLYTLMAYSSDDYTRYNASQTIYKKEVASLNDLARENKEPVFSSGFLESIELILKDEKIDDSFRAFLLQIPGEKFLFDEVDNFDFTNTRATLNFMRKEIASEFKNLFQERLERYDSKSSYILNPKEIAAREMLNLSMFYLAYIQNDEINGKLYRIFTDSNNMTIELGSLHALSLFSNDLGQKASTEFFNKWKDETLVIQKWFSLQASNQLVTIEQIEELTKLAEYDKKIPNLLRSLVGVAIGNTYLLNLEDGSGFKYFCDKIIDVDSYNPQIAARMSTRLNHSNKLDDQRASLLRRELTRVLETKGLSKDTFEIVKINLS